MKSIASNINISLPEIERKKLNKAGIPAIMTTIMVIVKTKKLMITTSCNVLFGVNYMDLFWALKQTLCPDS